MLQKYHYAGAHSELVNPQDIACEKQNELS